MTPQLQPQVESILELLIQEPTLRSLDITAAQSSLRKVISPTFEIVFALHLCSVGLVSGA
jgi:hypothetical protein